MALSPDQILFGDPIEEEQTSRVITFGEPITARQETPAEMQPTMDVEAEADEGWLSSVGGTFVDVAQGVGSGLLGLPQGILETGTAAFDYIFDTDSSRSVTNFFEGTRDYLGLRPDSAVGETVESITTFGAALIPVVGWVGRASSVARGMSVVPSVSRFGASAQKFGSSKLGKTLLGSQNRVLGTAQRAAVTSFAGGAAEFMVAPDGTGTLADAFDSLPAVLRTESDSGLQGRDEAHRRLFNKFKIGTEAVGIGLAAEATLPALGIMTNVASRVPGVPAAAGAFNRAFEYAGNKIGDSFGGAPRRYFTFAGDLEREIAEDLATVANIRDTQREKAAKLFAGFDKEARKTVGGMGLFGRNKAGIQKAYDDLLGFLEGDKNALKAYGPKVTAAAEKMRMQVDELSDMAIGELEVAVSRGEIDGALAQNVLDEMRHNKGSYLRRLYEGAFTPNTKALADIEAKPQYKSAIEKISRILATKDKTKYTSAADAVQDAKYIVKKMIVRDAVDDGLSPEASMKLMNGAFSKGEAGVTRRPLYQLAEEMFKPRSKLMEKVPELRSLLNEIRDPKELYMRTVSDLATFNTANRLYSNLGRSVADGGFKETIEEALPKLDSYIQTGKGGRPLIISSDNVTPAQGAMLTKAGYTRLGEQVAEGGVDTIFRGKYGNITGDYVAPELYNALTVPIRSDSVLGKLYGASLQAKGLSQIVKTVLNPLSQVRNFYSGAFMVGANGNFMRNAEMGESLRLTFKKIDSLPKGEADKFATMIGELGLRDESLTVNEFKRLIRENVKSGDTIQTVMDKTPILKTLQSIYSDTDTYWKTVGFVGEKAKITGALRKAGIDSDNIDDALAKALADSGLGFRASDMTGRHGFVNVYASDIVKETMPIYTRVPEIIKSIRRIPLIGNFVAFPAEVLRNSTNIINRGLKELSFKPSAELVQQIGEQRALQLAKEIRAIGANRLASFATSSYVIPRAVVEAASTATGVSQEDIDKMRPLMPFFVQGDLIMPLSAPKDGKFEYIDLSYMMPYDFAFAPARTALEVYSQKGELGASEAEQIMSSVWSGLTTFLEPFAGEALLAERIQDSLPSEYLGRGGKTRTGAKVWSDNNDPGTKLQRSFFHILGGLYPAGMEYFFQPKPEGFVPGRLTRSMTGMPGGTGQEYDPREEFLTAVSGFRKMELNIPKSLGYTGFEYTSLRTSSAGDFKRVARRNDSTDQDIINAYVSANEDLFRAQRNMYGNIQAARTAGMSEGEIYRALTKDANIGKEEARMIMSGMFRPVSVSKDLARDILSETRLQGERRTVEMLPMKELGEVFRSLAKRSLLEPVEEEAPVVAPESITFGTPVSEAPQPQPVAPESITFGTPVTPQATTTAPALSTALMGSNPITAMKNLQIAQRTQ